MINDKFSSQGLWLGPDLNLSPDTAIGYSVGQQKAYGFPDQTIDGILQSAPYDGCEIMVKAMESILYANPAYLVKSPNPVVVYNQNPTGFSFVKQKYDANYISQMTLNNLVLIIQCYGGQLQYVNGTTLMFASYKPSQPLELKAARLSILGQMSFRATVFNMQTDGTPISTGSKLYVRIATAANPYPVFMVNNDSSVNPDDAVYQETLFQVVNVLQNNQNTGTLSAQCILQNIIS
jgi:hypothetical protein